MLSYIVKGFIWLKFWEGNGMTRTREEITAEILRRIQQANKRGGQKRQRLKTAALCFAFTAAAAILTFVPWRMDVALAPVAAARAELLYNGIGGYVLIGVVCFAAGAAAVLIGLRKQEQN